MTTANNIETETSFERENNKDFESVPAEDNHGESQRELILVSSSRTRSNVSLDQDGKSPASSRTVTPKVRDTPGTSSVHDRPSGSNEGQENTITSEDRVVLEDGPADGDVTHAEADSTSANRTETVLSRTQSNFSERSGISRTNGNNKNSPSANAASTTDRTEKKTRKGTMLGNVEPTKNTGKNSREKTISCTNQSAIRYTKTSCVVVSVL